MFQKKWRSVPASHRFKALFRWLPEPQRNRKLQPLCNKSTKNRGSHPTASFTPALDINDKRKKNPSKAGGQRYLTIKGHARPMFNLLHFRRFTFTGYFVAAAGIEPATPPSWVVASFLADGDCGIRTPAYQLHGIPIFHYLFIV